MAIWYLYTNIWKPVGRLRVSPSLSSSLGTRCLYFTRPGEVDWIRYAEFVGLSDKKWNKLFHPSRKYWWFVAETVSDQVREWVFCTRVITIKHMASNKKSGEEEILIYRDGGGVFVYLQSR